jgi:tetratricopeptide (TPR) repeat protein
MEKNSAQNQTPANALWVYNPPLDLIVGCGAWSAPLLLVTYFTTTSNALAWSVGFYALALFFNYPHYMATLYRAYHREEEFQKYRIFTVHITGFIVLALVISHFWFRALPWIFTLYLTLSPWHYSGQNYGLFMMFVRRAGAKPANSERNAVYAAFLISYLILFVSFHAGASTDPLFISLGIPRRVASLAVVVLGIAFVSCSAFGLSRIQEQVGWRPLLPALTLFSSQFIWFLLPTALSFGEGLRIPQSRYSTGVLAVMHSAQYLWITSYYARREASAEGGQRWRSFAYFSVLVAGGIALFVPGPWLVSRVFHYDFTASFLIFTALANLHHFVLDGAIWKLRDGRIASLLVSGGQERLAGVAAGAGDKMLSGVRWLSGESKPASALRAGGLVLLLLWGTVDQVRYYLALHSEDLQDLRHAAALDSFDTSLQMRLARRALEEGKPEDAVAAARKAVAANPSDPVPRRALLKYLIEQKRLPEAYDLTRDSLRRFPKDANVLVNHGILALQLGHPEEAVHSWRQAIAVDRSQASVYLYLAGELQREGKADEAIPHYMAFLEKVAQGSPQERPAAQTVISAALKLGECQVQANHPEQAVKSYQLAEKIAAETGDGRLQSLAIMNQAGLQAGAGKTSEALRLYHTTLRLDADLRDQSLEAADWYSYALFLRDAGFSKRLVYACLLKSESLAKASGSAPALKDVSQIRADTEKGMGNQAASLRRDPRPAIEEALTLTR